jgi:hypothetical protein
MANRQSENLDNGTSLADSGFDLIQDVVNPVPGLDLDINIPNPGKMTSYESPSYECATRGLRGGLRGNLRGDLDLRGNLDLRNDQSVSRIPWMAICALALVMLLATRSSA